MTVLYQSVLSTEYVKIPVQGFEAGEEIDPTGDEVELAFTAITPGDVDVDPVEGDWKDATWETNVDGELIDGIVYHHYARILVGPLAGAGGFAALAKANYRPWLRLKDNPETIVRPAGTLSLY